MSVPETAAHAAAELRAVLTQPHSEGFIRTKTIRARVDVARALMHERVDPALSRTAQRRFLASRAAYDQMMAAFHTFPTEPNDLLLVLDALAGTGRRQRPEEVAA